MPGDTNKIFDICFSAKQGDLTFATAGQKHIKFWDKNLDGKRGTTGNTSGVQPSYACVAFDDEGTCFTGGSDSLIYVWGGRTMKQTLAFHKSGFVGALRFTDGKLYSGGKDGIVNMINTQSLTVEKSFDFGGVLIRAIDVHNN